VAGDEGELLTLKDAADRLGVHYMTIYRRVRLGMLPAHKVGGSWRIDPADLDRALTERAAVLIGVPADGRSAKPLRRAPWPIRLQQRMLVGDNAGSWQVVEAAMASGVEPTDVYVEMLGPALHAIGAAWQRGEIGIEQEHLASGVAASIVGRMGPRFRRRGRRMGSVLVAMPVGERHGLGVAMLTDILSLAGYEVLNLGTDTPPASLVAAMVRRDDLRAVIVSVVDTSRLPAAARLIGAARRADRGARIVAGGFAVPDERTAKRIGADGWTADPRRLSSLIAGPRHAEARRSLGAPTRR
jgi:excisionase family DNA binding protein